MAAKRKKSQSKKKQTSKPYIVVVALLLLLVYTLINGGDLGDFVQAVFDVYELPDPSVMRVTMLDVGQGDSIWLTSAGESILIDAGENSYGTHVARYLKHHGVDSLSAVIGTHPHSDHIGGIDTVIDQIPVGELYIPDIDYDTTTFQDVIDAAEDSYVDIVVPDVGDIFYVGQMKITFLHPDSGKEYENVNNYSICILVEHPYGSIILTGDAETGSEDEMLNTGLLKDVDVYKVGHHGSSSSTSDEFMDAITPEYALISCGQGNDYGHPHTETIEKLGDRGIEIYRTDKDGPITVDFTEGGIIITTG